MLCYISGNKSHQVLQAGLKKNRWLFVRFSVQRCIDYNDRNGLWLKPMLSERDLTTCIVKETNCCSLFIQYYVDITAFLLIFWVICSTRVENVVHICNLIIKWADSWQIGFQKNWRFTEWNKDFMESEDNQNLIPTVVLLIVFAFHTEAYTFIHVLKITAIISQLCSILSFIIWKWNPSWLKARVLWELWQTHAWIQLPYFYICCIVVYSLV